MGGRYEARKGGSAGREEGREGEKGRREGGREGRKEGRSMMGIVGYAFNVSTLEAETGAYII